MSRQTARLFFQGHDHKDLYVSNIATNSPGYGDITQGYISAVYAKKENTSLECYWRKIYDYKYLVYSHVYSGMNGSYNMTLLYPDIGIKELGFGLNYRVPNGLYANNRYVVGYSSYNDIRVYISKNGKIFRSYILGYGYPTVPVDDGFMYVERQTKCIKYIELDDELNITDKKVVSGTEEKDWHIDPSGNCFDNGVFAWNEYNFCFVTQSGFKKIAKTNSRDDVVINTYGGGKYYVIYKTETSAVINGTTTYFVTYKKLESEEGQFWKNSTVGSYSYSGHSNNITSPVFYLYSGIFKSGILYKDGKFLVYHYGKLFSNDSERYHVYETSDFHSFKLLKTAGAYMILPILGQKKKLYLRLGGDSPIKEELGLGEDYIEQVFANDTYHTVTKLDFSNKAEFIGEKRVLFDCLLFEGAGWKSPFPGGITYTVYIDNLYFEESPGNYALNPNDENIGCVAEYEHGMGENENGAL